MIVPPILPRGVVVTRMRNKPYRCHQPLHLTGGLGQSLLWVPPQPLEGSLIQRRPRFALPHHPRIVAEFRVGAS